MDFNYYHNNFKELDQEIKTLLYENRLTFKLSNKERLYLKRIYFGSIPPLCEFKAGTMLLKLDQYLNWDKNCNIRKLSILNDNTNVIN